MFIFFPLIFFKSFSLFILFYFLFNQIQNDDVIIVRNVIHSIRHVVLSSGHSGNWHGRPLRVDGLGRWYCLCMSNDSHTDPHKWIEYKRKKIHASIHRNAHTDIQMHIPPTHSERESKRRKIRIHFHIPIGL